MYLIGFAAAWWLARWRAARPGSTWKANDVDDVVFYAHARRDPRRAHRLRAVLRHGVLARRTRWYPVKIWEGGMSFHGGMLGVIVAMAIFARRRGRNVADVFDFSAPLPGIGLFAGRIGNFINGELWGKPTTVPWGFMVDGAGAPRLAALRGLPRRHRAVRGAVVVHVEAAAAARAVRAVPAALRRVALRGRVRARAG